MPALQAARVGSSVFQGFNGRRHHHRTSCTSFALLDTFSKNAATSKPDPGTTSVSIPVTSTRRQLLSAAILSGTVLLQGTETASAKTTIASLKLGAQYERDIEVTARWDSSPMAPSIPICLSLHSSNVFEPLNLQDFQEKRACLYLQHFCSHPACNHAFMLPTLHPRAPSSSHIHRLRNG